MPSVESLLSEHVTLKVDCVDRLYLNGYVPKLQRPENLWWFLTEHRGCSVVSPILLKKLTDEFVRKIERFVKQHDVPVVRFEKGDKKEEIAREYLNRFDGEHRST